GPSEDSCYANTWHSMEMHCEIWMAVKAYLEKMCEPEFKAMRDCCSKYTAHRSVCCSGFQHEGLTLQSAVNIVTPLLVDKLV
uniref:Uncharacterized protein n=1 Tax=Xenopus tropicalis TaxID=8364 RepID=A0A803JK28_XENTR